MNSDKQKATVNLPEYAVDGIDTMEKLEKRIVG